MQISKFKVPCTLTRVGDKVEVTMDESKKVLESSEELSGESLQNLPGIAQKIAAENENYRTAIKKTLLASERESQGFIILKIIS